jgi:hypothetical protein
MGECTKTDADYLMYTASVLYFCCYIPELYANYVNKNANIYNVTEKGFMLTATSFALAFSIINNNPALISNYGPIFALDVVALLMKSYYACKNRGVDVKVITV